jgi:16S rRNA (cytosine967-C5)-methyltransferase
MCSSPGGKTTHIAELMNNTGKIIACDIYSNRLNLVNDNAKRLGITNIQTKENDGTILNNEFIDKFDKVLVDAPCSGIGVIRRKVDIKYQRKEELLIVIKALNKAIHMEDLLIINALLVPLEMMPKKNKKFKETFERIKILIADIYY